MRRLSLTQSMCLDRSACNTVTFVDTADGSERFKVMVRRRAFSAFAPALRSVLSACRYAPPRRAQAVRTFTAGVAQQMVLHGCLRCHAPFAYKADSLAAYSDLLHSSPDVISCPKCDNGAAQ